MFPLFFAPASPATDACQNVRIGHLARYDAGAHGGYAVSLLAAESDPPTSGVIRLLTPAGHLDVPFTSNGALAIDAPPTLRVTGGEMLMVDGITCDENGVSVDAPGSDAVRIHADTPHVLAGAEIADDGPHCDRPFLPAAAKPLHVPETVEGSGAVAVIVSLDSAGRIVDAQISISDNAALNATALALARAATYTPAIALCAPAASNYVFTVFFGKR